MYFVKENRVKKSAQDVLEGMFEQEVELCHVCFPTTE